MKKISFLMIMVLVFGLTACGTSEKEVTQKEETKTEVQSDIAEEITEEATVSDHVMIELSNSSILVNKEEISEDPESTVYKANDIIFYLEGQGIEYGEGTEKDEHSQIEADAHTVVHITEPGTYEISGTLEAGQIFVDLGEEAKDDPDAIVNLILNNADITCLVGPGIFFYNVYECAEVTDEEEAVMEVDTTAAGANITLADGSKNKVYGSYVARIYESCELSEDGSEVIDSKKLHKYDGAVYSKMSMNVFGDTGKLEIVTENEGLDTEMHLSVYGGNISIQSGNDGINVNEDNVSVFHMINGNLKIVVNGSTGEGDGIDSNGWLIISGGTVKAYSCASSEDAGLDADKGIYIHGGTVEAFGNMMSEIAGGEQASVSFMTREPLENDETYEVKDAEENEIMKVTPENTFKFLVISAEALTSEGVYSLWEGNEKIADGFSGKGFGPGMGDGMRPEQFENRERPEFPEGMEPPEGFERDNPPEREKPEA